MRPDFQTILLGMIYLNFDLTVRMIMIVIMIMLMLFLGAGEVGGSVTAELSSCVGAIEDARWRRRCMLSTMKRGSRCNAQNDRFSTFN